MKKIFIKYASEIFIKSKKVRLLMIKKLFINIKKYLSKYTLILNLVNLKIIYFFDRIEIFYVNDNNNFVINYIFHNLKLIPGISKLIMIDEFILEKQFNLNDIFNIFIKKININILQNKTFCIQVKRLGNHTFTSSNIKAFLATKILQLQSNTKINLNNSDIQFKLELNQNKLYFYQKELRGIKGFPIGTQGTLLSLLSGGFDSAVSSYLMLKKGCKLHFCYFDFYNTNQQDLLYITNLTSYLYNKLSTNSYQPKLFIINFSIIINELIKHINPKYISLIIKYFMYKISKLLCNKYNFQGTLTGESLGQVSSQTIYNLNLLNNINLNIFRPLISYNKSDIIYIAKKEGFDSLCNLMPEYCGIFSYKATAHANRNKFLSEINKIDKLLLYKSIKQIKFIYLISNNNINNNISYNYYDTNVSHLTYKYIKNLSEYINNLLIDITMFGIFKNNHIYKKYLIIHIPFISLLQTIKNINLKNKLILLCQNEYIIKMIVNKLINEGYKNIYIYIKS